MPQGEGTMRSLCRNVGHGWSTAFSLLGGVQQVTMSTSWQVALSPAFPRPPVTILGAFGMICTQCFNPHNSPRRKGNVTIPTEQEEA